MTTANKITIVRILLVPFFVAEMIYYIRTGEEVHRLAALLIFAIAAFSDGLDGYIARRYNQRSELGTVLDPIADKLLLVCAIVILSFEVEPHFERIPLWLTVLILGRDLIVVIGVVVVHYTVGKVHVRPRASGKVATVFQMSVVLWTILHWDHDALPWLYYATGILTAMAGLLYVWDGVRQLNNSPSSGPTKVT
jgi:cardiolipin synthase